MASPAPTRKQVKVRAMESHTSLIHLINSETSSRPIGIKLFGLYFTFSSQHTKRTYHKTLVIILTFVAYAAFHMGRRPLSVVKNVLDPDCKSNTSIDSAPTSSDSQIELDVSGNATNHSCGWAPFDDKETSNQLLGLLDTAFLLSYAIAMFSSGIIAERVNLRYFISFGAIISGLGLVAFGLARMLNIHSMAYFVAIQTVSGAAQSIGWPVVVTCVSNWFEPSKRGLIYGLWNSHTSLGNILGATLAGVFVETDWGLSFIVPGVVMIIVGLILFLFLVPAPIDVKLTRTMKEAKDIAELDPTPRTVTRSDTSESINVAQVPRATPDNRKAVSFMDALKIPGVIEFSFCLFFSKLVSYTFLYWLPKYIKSSTSFSSEDSAYLSTPFDIGGIMGAILAGWLSDKFMMNGLICNVMLILAIPSMFVYESFGAYSSWHNIILQLIAGLLVNGPYCLITTAVSADLGERIEDGHAMATVSAIIDGMGSLGAVVGPMFAGIVAGSENWQAVFFMLMLSDVFASVCLARVTIREIKDKFFVPREPAIQ